MKNLRITCYLKWNASLVPKKRTKFLSNSDTNFPYVHAADGVSYPNFYWPGGTVFSPQAWRRRACSYNNDFELSATYF